jgi:hypothetical protein
MHQKYLKKPKQDRRPGVGGERRRVCSGLAGDKHQQQRRIQEWMLPLERYRQCSEAPTDASSFQDAEAIRGYFNPAR